MWSKALRDHAHGLAKYHTLYSESVWSKKLISVHVPKSAFPRLCSGEHLSEGRWRERYIFFQCYEMLPAEPPSWDFTTHCGLTGLLRRLVQKSLFGFVSLSISQT